MQKRNGIIIANFGGPRSIEEIESFLEELLLDRDVVRTNLPSFVHNYIFRRIAKKRAGRIANDYDSIGGKSPIFADTESIAEKIALKSKAAVITFHRYLPKTHAEFIKTIQKEQFDELKVFPMFPQFTYATTGSIARWFNKHLPPAVVNKMRWIKSYASHPSFIKIQQKQIKDFIKKQGLVEKESILLFSAHGVPQKFVESGDLYLDECRLSFKKVASAFPEALCRLSFQSKFGPDEWLKPYTEDVCKDISGWHEGRQNVLFIPISFTSDHIETLFEIEKQYMPLIEEAGLSAYRVPALNQDQEWINTINEILLEDNLCNTQMLIRKWGCKEKCPSCKSRCSG